MTALVEAEVTPDARAAPASRARLGGWLAGGASVVLVVLALVDAPHAGRVALGSATAAAVLCWTLAGLTLVKRVGALGALASTVALGGGAALAAARVGNHHGLGVHGSARDVAVAATLFAAAATVHLVLALPDGVLAVRGRQVGAAAAYTAAAVGAVYLVATGRGLSAWPVAIGWAVALAACQPVVRARYMTSPALGRQRVQSLVAGTILAAMVVVVIVTLHWLIDWPAALAPALIGASALVPLGLAAGSLRVASHADRVLVHLLTTLGTVVVVAGAYLIALRVFTKTPSTHSTRNVLAWAMAAAAVAAVAQLGFRARFSRLATGFTYGAREAPDEVVRTFGSRLTRAIPMDELLLQLVESLRKTLALASAEIYTGNGEILDLVVSVPDVGKRSITVSSDERAVIARAGVSGNAWASVWIPAILAGRAAGPLRVAPISHGGELLGIIVIARGEGGITFREEDDRVLADLARQVGLALHNAQLDTALQSSMDELRRQADELRASRARVVASGDAERRRVERNLHDGAQQHLVALAVNLRLAKDVIAEDPAAGAEMLEELQHAVQETIQELRELAHGIYPPLLVDSGLPEALRAVATRSPLDVELVTEGIGRYGGDVEAAIYFCCLEALQNAGKHAPDSHVVIRVWEESGGLLFEVRDDGPGFDVRRAQRGHGFVNMSDRLGAIGGAVRWESGIGRGTTIRGSVPLG
ncbi:MAG: GAF domain-containing sensor histidine kinase [Acidimicrobiales bacterium]